jgi:predicted Zn-dependent protease with MMP-like domain
VNVIDVYPGEVCPIEACPIEACPIEACPIEACPIEVHPSAWDDRTFLRAGYNDLSRATGRSGARIVTMPYRVGKDEFAELVEQAIAELPAQFAALVEEVPIEIADHATIAQRRRLNLRDDELLLGLYQGRPRTRRSVEDSGAFPDVIYIFQNAIESVSHDRDGLLAQVRKTVLHEIGHHFGLSESDLDGLGYR